MMKSTHLRSKLEASIRAEKERAADVERQMSASASSPSDPVPQAAAPSIKLKMDFSNFKS
jgi:hypothetical protein